MFRSKHSRFYDASVKEARGEGKGKAPFFFRETVREEEVRWVKSRAYHLRRKLKKATHRRQATRLVYLHDAKGMLAGVEDKLDDDFRPPAALASLDGGRFAPGGRAEKRKQLQIAAARKRRR